MTPRPAPQPPENEARGFSALTPAFFPAAWCLPAGMVRTLTGATALHRLFIDLMHAVGKRQQQMLRDGVEEYYASLRTLCSGASPAQQMEIHVDTSKQVFEKSVRNLSELGEIVGKSQREILEMLTVRAADFFEDTKKILRTLPLGPL